VTETQGEMLAIQVIAMPRDTNAHGTIFGGVILSLIDQAGALAANAAGAGKVVTVAMREVEFKAPVFVGDTITCFTRVLRRGRTSITVAVRVVARQASKGQDAREVTQAEVVYVHVDEAGQPRPLPPTPPGAPGGI
jgi:acyl-CoA thioesterase YciA